MGRIVGLVAALVAGGVGSSLLTRGEQRQEKQLTGVSQIIVETGTNPVVRRDGEAQRVKRVDLTSAVRTELTRVGCMAPGGDTGWTEATRAAAQSFVDRVGAGMTIQTPDYILLTLLRGHAGNACGRGCTGDAGDGTGACGHERIAGHILTPEALLPVPSRKKAPDVRGEEKPVSAPPTAVVAVLAPVHPVPVLPLAAEAKVEAAVVPAVAAVARAPQRQERQQPAARETRRQVTVTTARLAPRPSVDRTRTEPRPAVVRASSGPRGDVFSRSRDNAP